jgi:hypothetical protein
VEIPFPQRVVRLVSTSVDAADDRVGLKGS